jgi:hypothetical protein
VAENRLTRVALQVPTEIVEHILLMMEPEMGEMDREDRERILGEFASLGFEQLYDWLSGRKRYRTLTEQHTEWLENIYTRLLPEAEVPGYSRLYNKFNIPYGQAGYIIRVLLERELPHLRRRAREDLKSALENVLPDAQEAIEDNRPDQPLRLTLSLLAEGELRNAANVLYRRDDATLLPEKSFSYGDTRTVMLPAKTVGEVLEDL